MTVGYILGVGIYASVHVSTCQEHRPLQSFEDRKISPHVRLESEILG